jgi:hypothetical protein
MDLREIGWECVDWICLTQDRDHGNESSCFHKRQVISWQAEHPSASQEGPCSMGLLCYENTETVTCQIFEYMLGGSGCKMEQKKNGHKR